jgi:hypothetical protein
MTLDDTKKVQKITDGQFYCEKCEYSTVRKSQYFRHLETQKHIIMNHKTNNDDVLDYNDDVFLVVNKKSSASKYMCHCGKEYSYRQGLWKHKINCKKSEFMMEKSIEKNTDPKKIDFLDKNFVIQLLKDNQEFKELIIEQNKKLSHISNEKSIVINNTSTNCNNNNKQFNLQFFLNETCKNAMNITDFVDSLEIKSGELEDLGKLGYVQGISNIFIRGLKELDETERPLHCTDKKREVLYIKDNNVWEKDSEKGKVKKIVKEIAQKNFKRMPEWKKENPMSEDCSSKKHMEYMQILCEVMSGITPEDELGFNKIVRTVANQVYIDSSLYSKF